MPIERTAFLGLEFADLTTEDAVRWVLDAPGDAFRYVVTPNVDHIVRLDRLHGTARGDELARAYAAADLCLCDSRVLARLARLYGRALAVVPGSDLTAALMARLDPAMPITIIGGEAASIRALASRYALADVRHHNPPMGMLDRADAMDAATGFVRAGRSRIVFLAIGSPQSEILAHRIAAAGGACGTALCIGASIDFLVGKQLRAPGWVQRTGFEWAWRLVSEPRRLWRRYLVEGPRIFAIAWTRRNDQ